MKSYMQMPTYELCQLWSGGPLQSQMVVNESTPLRVVALSNLSLSNPGRESEVLS